MLLEKPVSAYAQPQQLRPRRTSPNPLNVSIGFFLTSRRGKQENYFICCIANMSGAFFVPADIAHDVNSGDSHIITGRIQELG
jgi:hypothetical protein